MRPAEILERLEVLWRKLDAEGLYVRANAVSLAIDMMVVSAE